MTNMLSTKTNRFAAFLEKFVLRRPSKIYLVILGMLFSVFAYSHQPDHSFIYIRVYEETGIEGRFELNVNELNEFLGLDLAKQANAEAVRPYENQIREYILQHSRFYSAKANYEVEFTGELGTIWTDYGSFIQFHFILKESADIPDNLNVMFDVFLIEDPDHINMLGVEYNWKAGLINNEAIIALDFTADASEKVLDLTDTSLWKGFVMMVKQGVWHIWIGLDHILFLVALILPSVVRRKRREEGDKSRWFGRYEWIPVSEFKPAFIYIIKVITFFTIAHTITLSMAALGVVDLPSRMVESIIALSIGLAALHNIVPIFKHRDWIIAFGFGLFHGFGFASVLGDLGFRGEHLTLSLLGFNIGVEIGQVVIIAAIFPFLYLVRKLWVYPKFLVSLSALLILISLYWFIERAFDVDLLLDYYIRREGHKFLVWLGLR